MNIDRIRTEHYVETMVALDTFDLIAERVRRLLSYGRRMSMTQRYTYIDEPPLLLVGLTVDTSARHGGLVQGGGTDDRFLDVLLAPGLVGFGLGAYASDGNATEEQAWKRYHDDTIDRRDMTRVDLVGGVEGRGPGREDSIVIRAWNGSAVCDEKVIAFEGAS